MYGDKEITKYFEPLSLYCLIISNKYKKMFEKTFILLSSIFFDLFLFDFLPIILISKNLLSSSGIDFKSILSQ